MLENNDLREESLKKVFDLAMPSGRLVEPGAAYKPVQSPDGATVLCSDEVQGTLGVRVASGSNNFVYRGYRSVCDKSNIEITGSGNTVFVGPYARLSNASIRISGNNNIFFFGAFSTVESLVVMLTGPDGRIVIGDRCLMSARIIIDRSDHHAIYDLATGDRINGDRDVLIDDHVWIGRDVRINKGASIGTDSVVGQGSVVSGALGSQCIFAGVPARCVREGVTWSRMKAESLSEMEASQRHQEFLKRVEDLRARIRSFESVAPAIAHS